MTGFSRQVGTAILMVGALVAGRRLVSSAEPAPRIAPSHAARTVWDSVYSAAQATRGAAVYQKVCAECHGPQLAGKANADDAPPLVERSLEQLVEQIDVDGAELVLQLGGRRLVAHGGHGSVLLSICRPAAEKYP